MAEKLPPGAAIRAYCTQCLGLKQFNKDQVIDCQGDQAVNSPCPIFPYRLGARPTVKVFRAFCLDCMCGDSKAVRECTVEDCHCHPYRFGKNPARRGQGASAEQMEIARESIKNDQISIFSSRTTSAMGRIILNEIRR